MATLSGFFVIFARVCTEKWLLNNISRFFFSKIFLKCALSERFLGFCARIWRILDGRSRLHIELLAALLFDRTAIDNSPSYFDAVPTMRHRLLCRVCVCL